MNIDLTGIMCAAITVLGGILLRYCIPILIQKLDQEKLSQLMEWTRVGVRAAEMLFATSQGREKKEFVLNFLVEKGYSLNLDEVKSAADQTLDVLIESAVKELKLEQGGR